MLAQDMRERDSWLAEAMAEQLTQAECRFPRVAAELMERLAETGGPG